MGEKVIVKTANGYMLDGKGWTKIFENKDEAVGCLKTAGFTDKYIESVKFIYRKDIQDDKINISKECIIARHVEGICLNNYEYILDEEDKVKVFKDKDEAVAYLKTAGLTDEAIEDLRFLDHAKFQEDIIEYVK